MVYSHDVIDMNENYYFLDIGEKVPPVLLWIEVVLLNKYSNQNLKINTLFIDIKSQKHFRQIGRKLREQKYNSVKNVEKRRASI